MIKVANYFPGQSYMQQYGGLLIEVGCYYYYLSNRVKVTELRVAEDGSDAVAYLETGFGEMAQVAADELGPWER